MSEIEFEVTAFFEDCQKLGHFMDVLSDFETGRQEAVQAILKKRGFKEPIEVRQLLDVRTEALGKRLRMFFLTPVHSDAGSFFAKFLGKSCAAVMVKEFNNQIAVQECYGYVSGRKRKLAGMIKALHGLDPDVALFEAVRKGRIKDVKMLLSNGANPNVSYDTTIPIMCVEKEVLHLLEIVLEAGADPNQSSKKDGNTMLLSAAKSKDFSFVELSLKHGADPNRPNRKGVTPLMVAVKHGNLESIKRLLEAKAMLEAKDNEGRTALMWACEFRQAKSDIMLNIVKFLLDAGADIKAVDHANRPIMAYANGEKCEKISTCAVGMNHLPGRKNGHAGFFFVIALQITGKLSENMI